MSPVSASASNPFVSGPWMSAFFFTLSVPIASKSNHRRAPRSSSWSRFRAFEDAVTLDARSHLPDTWPDLASDLPLGKRPVVCLAIAASTLLDSTNLSKSVADALQGVCYANDASARACSSVSVRSKTSSAMVAVAAMDPGVSIGDLAVASNLLLTGLVDVFTAVTAGAP